MNNKEWLISLVIFLIVYLPLFFLNLYLLPHGDCGTTCAGCTGISTMSEFGHFSMNGIFTCIELFVLWLFIGLIWIIIKLIKYLFKVWK